VTSRWVIVQHVPFEGPGLIARAIEAASGTVDVRRMYLGNPLPDDELLAGTLATPDTVDALGGVASPNAAGIAGLVVMGGPMGALDDAQHPFLAAERQLLLRCLAADVPVLAVCLGAQLLAAALGARVYTGAAAEVGLGTVTLTDAGRRDPVLGGGARVLPVLHWHGDTFDLPDGATLLASNEAYARQAYRIGSAYALQFHVEITADQLVDLEPELPPGVRIDRRHLALVNRTGAALLERFVASAMASRRDGVRNGVGG
jgi:GMP synthase (glutamine-hydrolysing)